MTGRVLSTDTAKASIVQMQNIINGPLVDQIEAMNREGNILSDANNWDGQLAVQFRSGWQQTYAALKKAKEELEELRTKIKQINDNIMTAGGNM